MKSRLIRFAVPAAPFLSLAALFFAHAQTGPVFL